VRPLLSDWDENPKVKAFGGYFPVFNSTKFSGSGVTFNGGEGSIQPGRAFGDAS